MAYILKELGGIMNIRVCGICKFYKKHLCLLTGTETEPRNYACSKWGFIEGDADTKKRECVKLYMQDVIKANDRALEYREKLDSIYEEVKGVSYDEEGTKKANGKNTVESKRIRALNEQAVWETKYANNKYEVLVYKAKAKKLNASDSQIIYDYFFKRKSIGELARERQIPKSTMYDLYTAAMVKLYEFIDDEYKRWM